MKYLSASNFLSLDAPILDIRSPAEYRQGHIPGANSFPLFSDEERVVIGTIYKNSGKKDAVKKGLEIVGPKMKDFISSAEKYRSESFRLYCWRGGMRSGSMGWLFEQAGFDVSILDKGYKVYRNELLSFFSKSFDLRILTGLTGSGKTLVLQEMQKIGAQVIDLEYHANHQGSSFGNQLSDSQPTAEMFQNTIYDAFLKLNHSLPIWMEDESISIGKVNLPEPLYQQMAKGKVYMLKVNEAQRIEILLKDYGSLDKNKLIAATRKIERKLGVQEAKTAVEHIENDALDEAAKVLLTYYDRQYRKSFEKKQKKIEASIEGGSLTPIQIAKIIIENYGH